MTGTGPTPPAQVAVAAAHALAHAFRARDVSAALACFAADADVLYAGSEQGELAVGHDAVQRLLTRLFARPECYDWQVQQAAAVPVAAGLYVCCEARGTAHSDAGTAVAFPYRLSGLLQQDDDGHWRWRTVHGAEPTPAT